MTDEDRVSDEATGLPPLHEVVAEDAVMVCAWDASVGVVQSPHSLHPIPVRYLHVRGLSLPIDGGKPEWVQCHIAVPVEHCMDVAMALAKGTTDDL